MAILGCEYAFISDSTDLVGFFRSCVGQYAKNASILTGDKVSWADAHRKLLAHAYRWLLYHYDQREAHVIHRSLIVHSFFWLAFAKSFDDRNRYGRIPFNPQYWMDNVKNGRTAMNAIGDPLSKADKLYSTLTMLFDDVRLQRLAVGTPCRENYKNQEEEIVRHLASLASDKQHDAFPLPASVPKAILVLAPTHRWWGQIPNAPQGVVAKRLAQRPLMATETEYDYDEEEEEAEMDTSAPESTDTEMVVAAERSLLITADRQALKMRNVAKLQRDAEEEARNKVQVQFYEVTGEDTRRVCLKREIEERDVEPKRRASPQQRPSPGERGRSILKKVTANTSRDAGSQDIHGDQDVPRGVGSPLTRLQPGVRAPMGTGCKAHQQTAFQDAMKQCYTNYASRSRLRKREHHQAPPSAPTPTQSPAQKTSKLKSIVTVVNKPQQPRSERSGHDRPLAEPTSVWCPTSRAPYHLIGVRAVAGEKDRENEEDLIKYIMNRFTWEHYGAELHDAANAFGGRTTYVARFCMAMVLYFEVAWIRGEKWIFPVIPEELTGTTLTRGGQLPRKPDSSKGRHAEDIKLRCREWWMYFLTLLQCWKDERSPHEYGGALRPDSKILLFVYYRVKHVFSKAGLQDFHLYQVKNARTGACLCKRNTAPNKYAPCGSSTKRLEMISKLSRSGCTLGMRRRRLRSMSN